MVNWFKKEVFRPFEVCPASWHGKGFTQKDVKRETSAYTEICEVNGSKAYTTGTKEVEENGTQIIEMPVFYDNAIKSAGRSKTLTWEDLRELSSRSVSQSAGERIKALWADGKSVAEAQKATGLSKRTIERAFASFNKNLP